MAEIKPSYDTKRTNLAEVIPLDSPFGMYIEPTRLCNFKCFYCMHATRGEVDGALKKTGFKIENMRMELFDKLVINIMNFPTQPKRICFSGLGDPLMNKDLPVMIKKLRCAGFNGRLDVLTNGDLLTNEMSNRLIEAGINRLQISIQGLNDDKYREICKTKVDFKKLVDNLKYFYQAKGENVTLFIKTIDSLLEDKEDEKKFHEVFSSICDTIFIEHLVIMQQQMGNHGGQADHIKNLNGEYVIPKKICSIMFYFLQVNIDGETFPCSTPGLPNSFSMGNANEKTLVEIWNDKKRYDLMIKNLKDGYKAFNECAECSSVVCIADKNEFLDDKADIVLKKLEK